MTVERPDTNIRFSKPFFFKQGHTECLTHHGIFLSGTDTDNPVGHVLYSTLDVGKALQCSSADMASRDSYLARLYKIFFDQSTPFVRLSGQIETMMSQSDSKTGIAILDQFDAATLEHQVATTCLEWTLHILALDHSVIFIPKLTIERYLSLRDHMDVKLPSSFGYDTSDGAFFTEHLCPF